MRLWKWKQMGFAMVLGAVIASGAQASHSYNYSSHSAPGASAYPPCTPTFCVPAVAYKPFRRPYRRFSMAISFGNGGFFGMSLASGRFGFGSGFGFQTGGFGSPGAYNTFPGYTLRPLYPQPQSPQIIIARPGSFLYY